MAESGARDWVLIRVGDLHGGQEGRIFGRKIQNRLIYVRVF